jgi:hypothetical protein
MHGILTGTDWLPTPEQRRYTTRRYMEYLKTNLYSCTRTESFALIPFHLNYIVRMIATEILWMSSGDLDSTLQIPSEAVPKTHESATEKPRMMSKDFNTNVPQFFGDRLKRSATATEIPSSRSEDTQDAGADTVTQNPKAITTSTETQSMIPRLSLRCMQILLRTELMTTPTTAEIYQSSQYSVCAYC